MKTKLFILIIPFLLISCKKTYQKTSCSDFYVGQNKFLPPDSSFNMYIIDKNNDTTKVSILNPSNYD